MLLARFEQKQQLQQLQQLQQQQQQQQQQQFMEQQQQYLMQQQQLQQQQQQKFQQQQQQQQERLGQQYPSSQGIYNMVGLLGHMGQSLIRPMQQQQQQQPQPIEMVRPQDMPTQQFLNILLDNMINEFEWLFNKMTTEKRKVWLLRTISNSCLSCRCH